MHFCSLLLRPLPPPKKKQSGGGGRASLSFSLSPVSSHERFPPSPFSKVTDAQFPQSALFPGKESGEKKHPIFFASEEDCATLREMLRSSGGRDTFVLLLGPALLRIYVVAAPANT